MTRRFTSASLLALALGGFGVTAAIAQHEGHTAKTPAAAPAKAAMSHDSMMMSMSKEPHHVLAMAYRHNLATFAEALQEQAGGTGSLDAGFARDAVSEMRRSFDHMKEHHHEAMEAMSPDMRARMNEMTKAMETHQAELNDQLTALQQAVGEAAPDAKKVATIAASVRSHLDAMAKMKHDGKAGTMKM